MNGQPPKLSRLNNLSFENNRQAILEAMMKRP